MSTTFYKDIGERIKKLRLDKGLSQEKAAAALHIGRVSYSQIESGKRKLTAEEISKISKIFNIPTDALLNPDHNIEVSLEKNDKPDSNRAEVRINVPQKKIAKFKEVLIYILTKVGSRLNVGETVIYKLLYFIDFDYYEKYEEQLIGATYMKNHYGPTPIEFKKIVDEMEGSDLAKVKGEYFQYPQTKYLPLREPDLSKLDGRELKLIDEVLERFSYLNANEISEYSHKDIPWLTTEDGKTIDYEKAFYRTPPHSVRSYSTDGI